MTMSTTPTTVTEIPPVVREIGKVYGLSADPLNNVLDGEVRLPANFVGGPPACSPDDTPFLIRDGEWRAQDVLKDHHPNTLYGPLNGLFLLRQTLQRNPTLMRIWLVGSPLYPSREGELHINVRCSGDSEHHYKQHEVPVHVTGTQAAGVTPTDKLLEHYHPMPAHTHPYSALSHAHPEYAAASLVTIMHDSLSRLWVEVEGIRDGDIPIRTPKGS